MMVVIQQRVQVHFQESLTDFIKVIFTNANSCIKCKWKMNGDNLVKTGRHITVAQWVISLIQVLYLFF